MDRRPCLIGLLGRSRVGKDTVAELLRAAYPEKEYRIWRFAEPVKRAVAALYGFTPAEMETDKKETVCPRRGVSPREAMQFVTRTYMDKHGSGFFSEQLLYAWEQTRIHTGVPPSVIIPDVRYPDDIARIREHGGVVIKVERPNAPVRHSCEDHIDALIGDAHVTNDGDIEALRHKVAQLFYLEKPRA